jgi:hypothetical protein
MNDPLIPADAEAICATGMAWNPCPRTGPRSCPLGEKITCVNQQGLLTLLRKRTGGNQQVTVKRIHQQVNVTQGGQAVTGIPRARRRDLQAAAAPAISGFNVVTSVPVAGHPHVAAAGSSPTCCRAGRRSRRTCRRLSATWCRRPRPTTSTSGDRCGAMKYVLIVAAAIPAPAERARLPCI